jgi:hypothetical protein
MQQYNLKALLQVDSDPKCCAENMIEAGNIITFSRMPDWVNSLPEESRRVFRACFGKSFHVSEIDQNGLCVLDVSQLIDPMFGGTGNDIRLETEFLKKE